jgi:hypothetical protein
MSTPLRPSLTLSEREEFQPIGPVQKRPVKSLFDGLVKKVPVLRANSRASLGEGRTDLAVQSDGAPKVVRVWLVLLPAIAVLPHTKGHPP